MAAFATVQDVITLWRALTPEETERAEAQLDVVSARLRQEAFKSGKDLDQMIETDETGSLAITAKSVTVDIVARVLSTPTTGDLAPLSQYSQSGLGYTFSGTFLSGGGGIFIKKTELAALGIKRPKFGFLDLMGENNDSEGNNS